MLPLDGLTVLEFGHTVMGPACGLVLADLGANVVRVEPAPHGDPTRTLRGFATGFFSYFNRNKRSVCIDLKSPAGLAVARELVAKADVLLENYGPGTMDRLGLGWSAVHELNPRLVYCELKGFLPGPYENRPAMDEVVQFMGGLAYMTGPPGNPLRAGSSVVDITGGLMGAVAILAALRQRDVDDVGRKVTGTLYETVAFLVAQHMAQEAVSGEPAMPMPARVKSWGVYELYTTRSGERVFIAVISAKHWQSLCSVLGLQVVAIDERFATNPDRVKNRDQLRVILTEAILQRDVAELCRELEEGGVPFAPVRTPSDLFEDPQMNVAGRMLSIRMGNGKVSKLPPLPLAIDGSTMGLRLQPPGPGEHTDEVLLAHGYDLVEIAEMRHRQVVR